MQLIYFMINATWLLERCNFPLGFINKGFSSAGEAGTTQIIVTAWMDAKMDVCMDA